MKKPARTRATRPAGSSDRVGANLPGLHRTESALRRNIAALAPLLVLLAAPAVHAVNAEPAPVSARARAFAPVASGTLAVAASAASSSKAFVTDDSAQRFATSQPVRRIVSLAPHLTELVFAAGGGDRLVGVSRYSDFPREAQQIQSVGDAFALDLEGIVGLKPDLVIAWRSGLGQRQRDRLRALGLRVYESEVGSVDDIARTLTRLGAIMGTAPAADAAARSLNTRWQALQSRYAGASPLRVFYQVSSDPLMTVNGTHIVSRTIAACGGTNPFATQPVLVPTINWEAAALSDPQLIALASRPGDTSNLGRWPGLGQVAAVRHGRYAMLPPDLLSRMGPRFIDGAEMLCRAMDDARAAERKVR